MNHCTLPLLGGITTEKARKIIEETHAHRKARKNLFLLEVSSPLTTETTARQFNMYCTGIDSTLFSISGSPQQIGAVSSDIINQRDPNELTLTTLDDQEGTIKQWFKKHADAVVAVDGSIGLPGRYVIKVKLVHAYIEHTKKDHFWQKWLYRAGSLAINLTRQEDGLKELNLVLQQIDMFMPA